MVGEDPLLEWTMMGEGSAAGEPPDITVLADGRVRIGPRLARGEPVWRRLSAEELESLRELVFSKLRILEIDERALSRELEAGAAARGSDASSGPVELFTAPQIDAGTTRLRFAGPGGGVREIRHHDLLGDAQAYPEVGALQRLRRIELRMLELAQELVRREPPDSP